MKRWVSAHKLIERWDILPFELAEHLQNGLRGYTRYGKPVADSATQMKTKLRRRVPIDEVRAVTYVPQEITIQERRFILSTEKQFGAYLNWICGDNSEQVINVLSGVVPLEVLKKGVRAPELVYMDFKIPKNESEAELVIGELMKLIFKAEDIKSYEQANGITFRINASKDGEVNHKAKSKNRTRRYAGELSKARAKALHHWKQSPEMTTTDMAKHIRSQIRKPDGKQFTEKTITEWIRDLSPHYKGSGSGS